MNIRFKDRIIPLALVAVSVLIYLTYILPAILGTPAALTAVTSNSMKPTLEQGDLAIIAGYNNFGEVSKSDTIVYSSGEWGLIVHRVVEINPEEQTVRTKGDANPQMDPWKVHYKDIRGRVVSQIPYVGYIVMAGESMLSDVDDLGIPSPVLAVTLTGAAVVLFLSGLESPPWGEKSDSMNEEYVDKVKEFLSSDKKKTKIEGKIPTSEIFSHLENSIEYLGEEKDLTIVRCGDNIFLMRRQAINDSSVSLNPE